MHAAHVPADDVDHFRAIRVAGTSRPILYTGRIASGE
jgi:hypothetical protein